MREDPNPFDLLCWMIGAAVVISLLFQSIIN